ncbi:MAG: hypothetical protein O9327_02290 [Polaromonas sp.]|nr:hypothetical protein [Polaromonas sp.]
MMRSKPRKHLVDTPRDGKAWHERSGLSVTQRACEIRVPARMGRNPAFVRLSPAQSIERAEDLVAQGAAAVSIHQAKDGCFDLVATVTASGLTPKGDWAAPGVLTQFTSQRSGFARLPMATCS